jgi:hypothetical protein
MVKRTREDSTMPPLLAPLPQWTDRPDHDLPTTEEAELQILWVFQVPFANTEPEAPPPMLSADERTCCEWWMPD